MIYRKLGGKFIEGFRPHLADDRYYLTPLKDAKEIIKNSRVDQAKWTSERFDCDDFAIVLKAHFAEASYKDGGRRAAHCFGVIWGDLPGPHAINWMVNEDGILRFVEPQTDKIYLPKNSDRNVYFMMA